MEEWNNEREVQEMKDSNMVDPAPHSGDKHLQRN